MPILHRFGAMHICYRQSDTVLVEGDDKPLAFRLKRTLLSKQSLALFGKRCGTPIEEQRGKVLNAIVIIV